MPGRALPALIVSETEHRELVLDSRSRNTHDLHLQISLPKDT
jgi:hypothetical protein